MTDLTADELAKTQQLYALALKLKTEKTPALIGTLARKLNWNAEQREMGLSRRQFAQLMLCLATDPEQAVNVYFIAQYVGMSREVLAAFLQRAWESVVDNRSYEMVQKFQQNQHLYPKV